MAGKPRKTLKFQMMMSPEEAEVLDDWMFKNRIRSRAEAIRRLCQIGLHLDANADEIRLTGWDLLRHMEAFARIMKSALHYDKMNEALWKGLAGYMFRTLRPRVRKSFHATGKVIGTYRKLTEIDEIDSALAEADRIRAVQDEDMLTADETMRKLKEAGLAINPAYFLEPSPGMQKLLDERGIE